MRRKSWIVALLVVLIASVPSSVEGQNVADLEAQVEDASRRISEARVRADVASSRFSEAQSALDGLAEQLTVLEADVAARNAEVAVLDGELADLAVESYIHIDDGADAQLFSSGGPNEAVVRGALTEQVGSHKTDVLDQIRAARSELESRTAELTRQQEEQRLLTEQLAADNEALQREVANLQAEYTRLDAILQNVRAEERQRIIAETRRRAGEAAARNAAQRKSRSGGSALAGPWQCPIPSGVSFSNDWGNPRSGGRRHQGTDMMARAGSPIVAPVDGQMTQKSGGLGGLTFRITSDDGVWYYGAHMQAYEGGSRRVSAGEVIGYVGSTGNASTAHLHLEIHPGGQGNPINPYPTVAQYC